MASETTVSPVPTKALNVAVTKHDLDVRVGDKKTFILTGYEVIGAPGSPDVEKYNDTEKYVPVTVAFEEKAGEGKGKIVTKTLYVPKPASILVALDELPYQAHKQLGLITGDTTPLYRALNPLKYPPLPLGGKEKSVNDLTEEQKGKLVKEMTKRIADNPEASVLLLKAQFYSAHKNELTAPQFDAIFREAEKRALVS